LDDIKKKHDELDVRMKELEKKNHEYADKYSLLLSECIKASEKNKQLSKLINCLTSMLAIQSASTYKELPGPNTTQSVPAPLPFKNDSIKMIRKILLDSLKSLSVYNNSAMQAKQIAGPPPLALPMLENGHEDVKEPSNKSNDHDDSEYPINSSKFYQDHLLPESPSPYSRLMSPLHPYTPSAIGILNDPIEQLGDYESSEILHSNLLEKNDPSIGAGVDFGNFDNKSEKNEENQDNKLRKF